MSQFYEGTGSDSSKFQEIQKIAYVPPGLQAVSLFFRISHQHSHSLPQVLQTPVNWLQWGQLTVLWGGLPHFIQKKGIYIALSDIALSISLSSEGVPVPIIDDPNSLFATDSTWAFRSCSWASWGELKSSPHRSHLYATSGMIDSNIPFYTHSSDIDSPHRANSCHPSSIIA